MATAALLFSVAVIGGTFMAGMGLKKKSTPPGWLVLLHGLLVLGGVVAFVASLKKEAAPDLAAATLVALVVAAIGMDGLAICYFTIAALAGVVLFYNYHIKKRAPPVPLVVMHAAIAAAFFITLLAASMQ